MKTLAELFEDIKSSDEMKMELVEIANSKDKNALKTWMEEKECNATIEEAKAFLIEKNEELKANGELSPDELEQAAGGTPTGAFTILATTLAGGTIGIGVVTYCDSKGAFSGGC